MVQLIVVILIVLLVAVVVAAVWPRRSWLARRRTDRLIVHTVDGQTLEGLCREVTVDGLVLAAVRLVDHDVTLAGDVWVPRAKISMIQRHPAGTSG